MRCGRMRCGDIWRCGGPRKKGREISNIEHIPNPEYPEDLGDGKYVVTAKHNGITYIATAGWTEEDYERYVNIESDKEGNPEDIQTLTDVLGCEYDEYYSAPVLLAMGGYMDCGIGCGYNLDRDAAKKILQHGLTIGYDKFSKEGLYFESMIDNSNTLAPFIISYDYENELPIYIRKDDNFVFIDREYSLIDRDFFRFFGFVGDIECECNQFSFFLPIEYYNKILSADFREIEPDEITYFLRNKSPLHIEQTTHLTIGNNPRYSTLDKNQLEVYSLNPSIVSVSEAREFSYVLTTNTTTGETQVIIKYKGKILYTIDMQVIDRETIINTQWGNVVHNYADKTLEYNYTGGNEGTPTHMVISDRFVGSPDGRDISSSYRRGSTMQYGNNAPLNAWQTPQTTEQIDASGYGPGNYFYREVYYNGSENNRDSSNNQDLWGYLTRTEEAMQGPCPEGFHIPTDAEFENLIKIINGIDNNNTKVIKNEREIKDYRWLYLYGGYVMRTVDGYNGDYGCRGLYGQVYPSGKTKTSLCAIKPFKNTN